MAVTITPEDVFEFYPPAADVPTNIIEDYICLVDQADMCLDGAGVEDCVQRLLKLNAVAYLLCATSQAGNIKQMKSPTGESVTFVDGNNVTGLNSNQYGRMLRMLDKNGCIIDIIETPENERFIETAGSC